MSAAFHYARAHARDADLVRARCARARPDSRRRARRLRARRRAPGRSQGVRIRPRQWLRPATGVGCGASRCRPRARRPHRRGPAGIRLLRRRAARASTRARPRRGTELRPPAQGARARRGRDRGPADGRRGPRPRRAGRRASRAHRSAVLPVHDSDLPESQRSNPLERATRRGWSRSRGSTSWPCSRTIPTGSCASRALRRRACSSSREAPS